MRAPRYILPCVLTLGFLSGCCGLKTARLPSGISELRAVASHRKHEILTRQWLNTDDVRMSLLELKIEETAFGRPFAFASYGEQATGHVYCLEVFEYRDALPSSGDALLFLVCHDYRPSRLIRYEIEEQNGALFLSIQREIVDGRNGKLVRNCYSYRYDRERGFLRTMSDLYSPAP